jgi:hypothetical protein
MKKVLAFGYLVVAIFFTLPSNCKAVAVSEKIKDLKEYFSLLKSANAEYKQALKEYDIAVQKQCSKEIENLAKASKNLFDANPWDFQLMKLLGKAKTVAQEELDVCIAEKCKDAKAKLDIAAQQLQERSVRLQRALLVAIGGAIIVGAGVYFGPAIKGALQQKLRGVQAQFEQYRRTQQGYREQERATKEKSDRIRGLIKKHKLADGHTIKGLLNLFIGAGERKNKNLLVVDPYIDLSNPNLRKALAEAYFGERAEYFTDRQLKEFIDDIKRE